MNLCIIISKWLYRCILKTAGYGMKAKFRELGRLYLKIVKERSHLKCNEVRLNNDAARLHNYINTHTHICVCTHTHTYVYIYIYIYIYIHINTHTRHIYPHK